MAWDRRFRRDLVVGSGSYEIAHQKSGRAPRAQFGPSVFHRSRTMDQECLSYRWRFTKLLAPIHHWKLSEEKRAFVSFKASDGMRQFPVAPLQP